jgi:3-oxoacyl-[acyl-carrier-protein] synthase II
VFAGAVEEHSGARELLEPGGGLGEASVLLFMQTAVPGNRPALAEVVAVDTRLGEPRRALTGCLERVLAGLAADEVWGIASTAADPELSEVEREATGEVLGRQVGTVIRTGHLVGDTGAASGVLGVAALLAAAAAEPGARGRLALATSVDRDGTAGAVVLRLTGSPHELRGE